MEHFGFDEDEAPIAPFLLNPAFMDDYAVPILASAPDILAKSRLTMSIVHSAFLEYGMALNMKPGKTALLLGLFGKGAVATKMVVDQLPEKVSGMSSFCRPHCFATHRGVLQAHGHHYQC